MNIHSPFVYNLIYLQIVNVPIWAFVHILQSVYLIKSFDILEEKNLKKEERKTTSSSFLPFPKKLTAPQGQCLGGEKTNTRQRVGRFSVQLFPKKELSSKKKNDITSGFSLFQKRERLQNAERKKIPSSMVILQDTVMKLNQIQETYNIKAHKRQEMMMFFSAPIVRKSCKAWSIQGNT